MLREELLIGSGVDAELNVQLANYWGGYPPLDGSEWHDLRVTDYYAVLHFAFDRVCQENNAAVQEATGQGIKRNTNLYKKASKREFDKWADGHSDAIVDRNSVEFKAFFARVQPVKVKRQHIFNATSCVKSGDDLYKRKCWECSTVQPNVLKCGGCQVAHYCCKEHQSQAWVGGHQNSCKMMKVIRESVVVNLQRMEKAIGDDDILGNGQGVLRPCLELDALILRGIMMNHKLILLPKANTTVSVMRSIVHRYGPPSIDNYYENLAETVNGQINFVFIDTPNLTLKDASNDGGINPDEGKLEQSSQYPQFILSLSRLAFLIGFRPTYVQEQKRLVHEIDVLTSNADRTLFHTSREFIDRYRCYHVEGKQLRWKETKTAMFDFMRNALKENHKLPQKPPALGTTTTSSASPTG